MGKPVISDEAVEAAKAGIRAYAHVDWQADHLVEGLARAALEAAAPHMDYRGVNLEAVRAKRDWKVGDPE